MKIPEKIEVSCKLEGDLNYFRSHLLSVFGICPRCNEEMKRQVRFNDNCIGCEKCIKFILDSFNPNTGDTTLRIENKKEEKC